jgi:hypothetical protein
MSYTINPDDFIVRIELRLHDGTHRIKQYTFKGLFDAQARSIKTFKSLVSALKPESHQKPLLIEVLHNNKTLKSFNTESWKQCQG